MAQRVMGVVLTLFIATTVLAADPTGTLVFEVRDYESDVKLKKNVQKQLEHGALQWGFQGNELVIQSTFLLCPGIRVDRIAVRPRLASA